jgi:hypothetical protein
MKEIDPPNMALELTAWLRLRPDAESCGSLGALFGRRGNSASRSAELGRAPSGNSLRNATKWARLEGLLL